VKEIVTIARSFQRMETRLQSFSKYVPATLAKVLHSLFLSLFLSLSISVSFREINLAVLFLNL
jgi:hypothetical protein